MIFSVFGKNSISSSVSSGNARSRPCHLRAGPCQSAPEAAACKENRKAILSGCLPGTALLFCHWVGWHVKRASSARRETRELQFCRRHSRGVRLAHGFAQAAIDVAPEAALVEAPIVPEGGATGEIDGLEIPENAGVSVASACLTATPLVNYLVLDADEIGKITMTRLRPQLADVAVCVPQANQAARPQADGQDKNPRPPSW